MPNKTRENDPFSLVGIKPFLGVIKNCCGIYIISPKVRLKILYSMFKKNVPTLLFRSHL